MNLEGLNKCLRGELAAVETYQQALEKNRQQYGQEVKFQQLAEILKDHQEAASQVRSLVQRMGGTPSDDSGAWGTWSQTVMGTAKLLGDKAALKALKEGEESGLKSYESVAQDPSAPADTKSLLAAIITMEQEHVRKLDRLMEAA